jgi:hypothetical protein
VCQHRNGLESRLSPHSNNDIYNGFILFFFRLNPTSQGTDAFGVACLPYVSCWAGTCGNGTFSYTATHTSAPPQPGLADGHGSVIYDGILILMHAATSCASVYSKSYFFIFFHNIERVSSY